MATVRYTTINGEVIAEKRGGVRRHYVPDPLGSTSALLDNTQAQTDTFAYWPYGEVASRTGTTPTPFQYLGTLGYYQDNANRNYVRARYLSKDKGRWLNQDPLGLVGGDANLYRYAHSTPVIEIDPSGLLTEGVDDCGGSKKHPKPHPLGPCRNGGSFVCVTCYTIHKNNVGYPGICGNRPPQQGDCAIDNRIKDGVRRHMQCLPGDQVDIGTGGNPVTCTVCDGGQGHNGIDIFVPGNPKNCSKALKNKYGYDPTGWQCIQCKNQGNPVPSPIICGPHGYIP